MNLQSPTESLNSDSRPGSVIDEQENTSETPEILLGETERKETDEKLINPLTNIDGPESVNESSLAAGKNLIK